MNRTGNYVVAGAAGVLGLLVALPAAAAERVLVEQSIWHQDVAGLPDYVNMHIYVPDQLAPNPPIVVAPHHCQGTASSTYTEMASLRTIADSNGFIMIYPEATGQNCWDAGSERSMSNGGGGDTGAIVQMVNYALSEYDGDAGRVYVVGGSSGGIMTEALLGVYPDVFMAGISLMGVPCGCWAEGYNDITGNGSSAQWAGACAGGNISKTGQEWGDLARSFYPGYSGHRPRLQRWHGADDTVIHFNNFAESIKQWTNLLELSESPTGADTPSNGVTHQYWENDCGYVVFESFEMAGVAHNVPFDGAAVAAFFGLDVVGGLDPETEACGGDVGGEGGMGGSGGTDASGGEGGTGGSMLGGAGGDMAMGGAPASDGGGGTTAEGGGGTDASVGGAAGNAGVAGMTGLGGAVGLGGDPAQAGTTGTPTTTSEDSGCACSLPRHRPGEMPWATMLGVAALALLAGRRRSL